MELDLDTDERPDARAPAAQPAGATCAGREFPLRERQPGGVQQRESGHPEKESSTPGRSETREQVFHCYHNAFGGSSSKSSTVRKSIVPNSPSRAGGPQMRAPSEK